jgi:NaMN:DMB phosphoribosyltransferase
MLRRCPLVGAVLLALAAPLAAAQTADPPHEIPFQATVIALHDDGVVELKLTNTGAREAVASATGHLRRGDPFGQAMMLVKRADEGTRTIRKEAKMYLRYLEQLIEQGRRRSPRGGGG